MEVPGVQSFKRSRALAILFGCLALALSAYAFQLRAFIGFPDGFVTPIDRAERHLFTAFILLGLAAACGFFFLAFFQSRAEREKSVGLAAIVYLILMALFTAVDWYLRNNLDSGIG